MASNTFMKVDEVAEMLGISKSYAYKIVQKLNAELKDKGFLTIPWPNGSTIWRKANNPIKIWKISWHTIPSISFPNRRRL